MKITNNLGLPRPFVEAVSREYQFKDKRYSVTSILKGTCETILERRHHNEIQQDVSDMIWLIFGTAIHSVLENAQETDEQLKENKFSIDIDGYELSGIFDLYDAKEKKVTDYKSATVWKVIYDDWEDYKNQLLCYAYMLQRIGFECESGEIVALLKDHSKTKAKIDSSYPPHPVHVEDFKFTEQDIKTIEKFIYEKFKDIKRSEKLKDEELTPCTEKERWYSGDKFAVMKKGNKRAIRVLDSEEEAKNYIENMNLDSKHYIEFRQGENKKCNEYCNVCEWCPLFNKQRKE